MLLKTLGILILVGSLAAAMLSTYAQERTRIATGNGTNRERRTVEPLTPSDRPTGNAVWPTFDQCIVIAPESFEVAAQETGTIAELLVVENSAVARGQSIGKLNSESADLERQVAGLQAQVALAEAQDESDVRLAEILVEEAKLQLDSYEEMANKGDSSIVEVRQKRILYEQAKTRLVQSKAARVQRELKAKLAQASYLVNQSKVDRLRLQSPATGVVMRVDHRPGEWVTAGTTILKVVRMDELRVDFFVDIEKIDPSSLVQQSVQISTGRNSSGEYRFGGRISGYSPEVSSTGKVRVNAMVQNQKLDDNWILLPGMTVSLQILTASPK